MNVVLTGMPASGKTTVSEVLGKILEMQVVDTDALITARYGDITAIFETCGEARFRDMETEIVCEVSRLENVVVSTGGGCILRQENAEYFKKSGKIVFLKTSLETLKKRAGGGEGRPLLQGDAEKKLERLYKERSAIYERTADITVETDGISPECVAKKIAELIK